MMYQTYEYEREKDKLFNAAGMRLFAAIRDQVRELLDMAGAIDLDHAIHLPESIGAADTWEMMACVDMLVKNGELREVTYPGAVCAQDRLFIPGKKWESSGKRR